ncbi:MAG: hypothetical protein KAH12_09695, partial [Anaerolineales bacterium]|nr:hypothetical protein [Anaerolineales bacterium]
MHRVQRSKSKPAFIFTLFLIILCCVNTTPALADDGPHRTKAIQVDYPEHYWWLVRESDNLVECELAVDHKDIPTPAEIYQQCELEIYEAWANEAICEQENPEQASSCSGLYFQHVGEVLQSKVIDVELPPATIHLVPPKCSSLNDQFCEAIPRLKFITEEPLPNEWITQVQGTLNNIPFYCEGNSCEIQLRETGSHGISLEFWADSSFGDSSVH